MSNEYVARATGYIQSATVRVIDQLANALKADDPETAVKLLFASADKSIDDYLQEKEQEGKLDAHDLDYLINDADYFLVPLKKLAAKVLRENG